MPHITLKISGHFVPQPAIFLTDPQRIGEVVQRDHRRQAPLAQRLEHLPVLFQGGIIPLAGFRLDAAPLYRQAQRVIVHVHGAIKIFKVAACPPIAGTPGLLILEDMAWGFFPAAPIIAVLALDLMGSSRAAPQKTLRKLMNGLNRHREYGSFASSILDGAQVYPDARFAESGIYSG